ncbi:MAG: glycosyl hydrolase [Bacteroidota bacterium]
MKPLLVLVMVTCMTPTLYCQNVDPVNSAASQATKDLLAYLYLISGKRTLSGQHCAPLVGSNHLSVNHRITGQYPAVFGQDFGFSFPGYWDGINYRQRIVDEAIIRHQQGFIITLMWHAVPPTMDEPVAFSEGIQSELSDEQWQDLVTPGTLLHEKWQSQVDVIAWFLKQLKYAGVPVLWRPYHEMNGGWFWWGKKKGEDGYKRLFRMMYNRFTDFHDLNNLLWIYNANEVKLGVDDYATYYPGDDVVDVLATDVYSENFNQKNYDELLALAKDKPIALGEVGRLPSIRKLKDQPRWTWWMSWDDPLGFERRRSDLLELYDNAQVISFEDLEWVDIKDPSLHYPILR